jgi:branched-chain amino acid aminotransferase
MSSPQPKDVEGQFPLTPHPAPASDAERERRLDNPPFGVHFTDHMVRASWRAGEGWSDRRVEPFDDLRVHPAATGLNYGQQIFEGLKAYRWDDGRVALFQPDANAERFAASARRMALPELSEADFIGSLEALLAVDRAWVSSAPDASLYLRPLLIGSEAWLAVRPSRTAEYVVIASPVGPYFPTGVKPVSIWVSQGHHRANLGGTGTAKAGGNYGAAMLPQLEADAHGCGQVLFLDARTDTFIEELGAMNILIVMRDGSVATPRLTGTILEGVTRESVLALLRDEGREVEERDVALEELWAGIVSGEVAEVFACGTAAAIVPVGRLVSPAFDVTVADGEPGAVTMAVRERLLGIQYGRVEDLFGWMRVVG